MNWNPQGIYAKFLLRQPVVFFGENAVYGLAGFPACRVAVIHGSALTAEDRTTLEKCFRGRELAFFARSWRGEPDLTGIRPTVAALEGFGPDVLLAVGGGSVIDGAKLCRVLLEAPYFTPGRTRPDSVVFRTRFLAVPTVAGSGAEASSAAVYLDTDTGRKEMLVSHALQPEAVVLDPRYIRALPEKRQLPMLMDALAHLAEGYVSAVDNALADLLAEEGLRLLYEELSGPWEAADPLRLQYAAYLGGVVQNHCLVGAAHAAAHQMAAAGWPHGEAVAALLPAAIRTNAADPAVRARYDRLCARAGLSDTEGLLVFLDRLAERADALGRRAEAHALLSGGEYLKNASLDRGGKGNPLPLDESYWNIWLENLRG